MGLAGRGYIHGNVKNKLVKTIMPCGHTQDPVLPNLFLEVKGRKGVADVAQRQACYNNAVETCPGHSLKNYRKKPIYDGNAYTISSTYHARIGTLQIYAHHATKPTTPGGRPEYHMIKLREFDMMNILETCVNTLEEFRNGKEWTKEQRDRFIEAANTRARGRVRRCSKMS